MTKRATSKSASSGAETERAPPSVIVVCGDDELGKDEALAEILAREGKDADVVSWEARPGVRGEAEIVELARDLASRSLFASRRVIVVKDGDGLVKRAKALLPNLLGSKAGNRLVMRCTGVDQRLAFFKRVKEEGGLIVRERPKADHLDVDFTRGAGESALVGSIIAAARARGVEIESQAARELAMRVGNDRLAIASELEKCTLAIADRPGAEAKRITSRMIEALTPQSATFEPFRLFSEIATGDVKRALERVHGLLERGMLDRSGRRVVDPSAITIMVIAMLHQRLALLARYRDAVSRGLARDEIQKEIGVKNPGQMFFLQKEAGLPLVSRAEAAIEAMAEADRGQKTGEPPERVLPKLVARLAREAAGVVARGGRAAP